MASILIISPDPDTRRMLELAFDLSGFGTATAADVSSVGEDTDLMLLDIVKEEGKSRQSLVRAANERKRNRAGKLIVLLPRGSGADEAGRWRDRADLVVKKPYEFTGLIASVERLARCKKMPVSNPRRSSSSRRTPRRQSSNPPRRT